MLRLQHLDQPRDIGLRFLRERLHARQQTCLVELTGPERRENALERWHAANTVARGLQMHCAGHGAENAIGCSGLPKICNAQLER